MAVTKFPSGLVVKPHPFPKGLDPSTATNKQLVSNGLPPRPKDPTLLLGWENLMERLRTTTFIEPQFQRTNRRHGPSLHSPGTGGSLSANWSGAVVVLPEDAAPGADFFVVMGQWTVPNPLPAAKDFRPYASASWIGIDGWFPDGSSIIQIGVECDAIGTASGAVEQTIYLWWEWTPENEVEITSLAVKPGDSLTGVIVREGPGANIILSNDVNNQYTAFEVTFPTNTVVGNCAEWIVERPLKDGVLSQLANYGSVAFQEAWAGTNLAGGEATLNPLLGFSVDMIGDNGGTISKGSTAGRQVNCFFV